MCADFSAQDYLAKLIKIHEDEQAMKDELDIVPFDPPVDDEEENGED